MVYPKSCRRSLASGHQGAVLAALLRIFVACVSLAFAASAAPAQGPSLLFDPVTGEVLAQERAGEPWYPASLTKLMTAYIVFGKLKAGAMKLDQQLVVSELAASMPPSKIGVKPGKTVSADFALQALLVYSANDMAYVLAEGASVTYPLFVREMNAAARRLGMTGTHFVNPNGLYEPRQISTARDIGILASALLREYPEHGHYFSQPHVSVGKRKLANRNSLIRQMKDADGLKTGFVCNSGFNLAASATRNGRKLISIVFGASSGKARADQAQAMLSTGFTAKHEAPLPKIESIANEALGAIVPADLTVSVCKQKAPVTIVNARELKGWGISFGQYETAQKADMALRGRLLDMAAADAGGLSGVIEMPGQKTFSALLWNIDEGAGLSMCAAFRASKAYCDVMAPEVFAQIAALTPEPKPEPQPVAEGSEDVKPKPPKKKKKKK
jgi:D-alanyl-D-alanine carboxypeptidase